MKKPPDNTAGGFFFSKRLTAAIGFDIQTVGDDPMTSDGSRTATITRYGGRETKSILEHGGLKISGVRLKTIKLLPDDCRITLAIDCNGAPIFGTEKTYFIGKVPFIKLEKIITGNPKKSEDNRLKPKMFAGEKQLVDTPEGRETLNRYDIHMSWQEQKI